MANKKSDVTLSEMLMEGINSKWKHSKYFNVSFQISIHLNQKIWNSCRAFVSVFRRHSTTYLHFLLHLIFIQLSSLLSDVMSSPPHFRRRMTLVPTTTRKHTQLTTHGRIQKMSENEIKLYIFFLSISHVFYTR